MRAAGAIVLGGLLLAGCVAEPPPPDTSPAAWLRAARERHLAGESAAEFARLQGEAAGENRKQQLPDLARLVRSGGDPERRAELLTDTLRECVAIASVRLVNRGESVSATADRLYARELDFRSLVMLAEKEFLDSVVWKTPAAAARERELRQELPARFGATPDRVQLAMPAETPVSSPPEAFRRIYGNDPAALLRFGGAILALPGEFARQYIADPGFRPEGIWLEARRLAALAAAAAVEERLAAAYAAWRRDPSPVNLFRWRKWHYRRRLELSSVPLLRGSAADLRALESLMELQSAF